MKEHVVIIGGGFGGLNAARALKDAPVNVTLIDRRNHHLFQPLLYQVATGELSAADIASPLRGLLKNQANTRVLLGEVVDFDVANRKVILRDGPVRYDTLIVAAGSGSHYFGNEQWQRWAPSLKTIEDALDIRRRILTAFEAAERLRDPEAVRSWLTFVVVGGGPTGVEMAGALAEIAHETLKNEFRHINPSDARIVLVQSGERILPPYHPGLSSSAAKSLSRLGVEVLTGGRVTDVGPENVTVGFGDQSDVIPTHTILWAAGVKASPLGNALAQATGAPLDRGGRVEVEPDLSVPGHPEIFVIGDLANFAHDGGKPLPGVAQVAIQQGRYVGQLVKRRLRGKTTHAFHYQDRGNLATIGRNRAVAEIGRLRLTGWPAWVIWLFVHLMYQSEAENRVLVAVQWLWNYVRKGRSALLITEHEQPEPAQPAQISPRLATDSGMWPVVR